MAMAVAVGVAVAVVVAVAVAVAVAQRAVAAPSASVPLEDRWWMLARSKRWRPELRHVTSMDTLLVVVQRAEAARSREARSAEQAAHQDRPGAAG